MGTNVAGRAISVSSSATGTADEGSAIDITHNGNLAAGADLVNITSSGSPSSTSNLLAIEQSTGAGTPGAYGLYVSCTGTNVEAIKVDDGTVTIDESLTVSTATYCPDINSAASGDVALTVDGAGTGTISIGATSTGNIDIGAGGGSTIIGDGGSSNYATFSSAGALTFTGTARPTAEVFLPPAAFAIHTGSPALTTAVGNGINATIMRWIRILMNLLRLSG